METTLVAPFAGTVVAVAGARVSAGSAVAKRHAAGRRTARENLADLLDPGSFVEYGRSSSPPGAPPPAGGRRPARDAP